MQRSYALISALAALAIVGCGGTPNSTVVPISFDITVPGYTSDATTVVIIGDHPSLGNGALPGLKLRRDPDGHFRGAAYLTKGTTVHYHVQSNNPTAPEQDKVGADGVAVERSIDVPDDATTVAIDVKAWGIPSDSVSPKITFVVTVPATTPADATIYIAGNDNQLGPWQPNVKALTKMPDGKYTVQVTFDANQNLQYKYTRGSWDNVEKDATGAEIANRTLTADSSFTQNDTVVRWADQ